MRRFLATLGSFAVGTSAVTAADAPKVADPAALVQKLGDPQFLTREAAAKSLLKIGGPAIPAIQHAIDTTTDPGLRERAETLLPRLQLLAESELVLTPKLVKLDYKNLPLSTVVEDLKKATGIPLMLVMDKVALPTRTITLTAGDVPAWQAVEMLCAAAGLKEDHRVELPLPKEAGNTNINSGYYSRQGFSYYGGYAQPPFFTPSTAPILLVDGKSDPLPGSRQQAIRVLAVPGKFEGNRVIRGTGTVLLNLDVAPLPGLNWTGSSHVRVTKAEDEDGRPLFADQKPEVRQNINQYEWGGGLAWGGQMFLSDDMAFVGNPMSRGNNPRLTPVKLRTDDRAIKTLKRFEGVVVGEVNRANMPIIAIDDMVKFIGRSFDGSNNIKLSITDYKTAKDSAVTVKIHVEMPQQWVVQQAGIRGKMNLDDLNIGNVQSKLKFTDADGKAVAAPSQRSANYSGTQWSQTYDAELHFPKTTKSGPPTKVVMTGTKVTGIEIPFAMENVRLP